MIHYNLFCILPSVNLQVTVNNLTVHTSDSKVELACEMTLYVRADEDLQWFRDSEMIVSGTERYTVSYRNGLTEAALNGGNVTIPGRVLVLTISNPQLSDSGTYTCRILGTEQSANVQLSVEDVFPATPTPSEVTPTFSATPIPSEVTLTLSTFSATPIPSVATPAQSVIPRAPGATLSTEIIAVIVVVGLTVFTTIIIATVIIKIIVNRTRSFKTTPAPSNSQTISTDYDVNEGLLRNFLCRMPLKLHSTSV